MKPDMKLLTRYCETFFGFGSLKGPLWFIGMEEGGGTECNVVRRRLKIWKDMGAATTLDALRFHRALQDGETLFDENAPIQRTWNMLIAARLTAHGETSDLPARRAFQVDRLGRADADHCLLELLPLPSPTIGNWILEDCPGMPTWMADRRRYRAMWEPRREKMLAQLISEHRPLVVIMYGRSYLPSWQRLANDSLQDRAAGGLMAGAHGGTRFFALPHPRRSNLEAWHAVGRLARPVLARGR